jgi:hypothetical protein
MKHIRLFSPINPLKPSGQDMYPPELKLKSHDFVRRVYSCVPYNSYKTQLFPYIRRLSNGNKLCPLRGTNYKPFI